MSSCAQSLTDAVLLKSVSSDRILVMDRGEISAFAPPLELFDRHDGIFYSLCVQSNVSRDDILKAQAS